MGTCLQPGRRSEAGGLREAEEAACFAPTGSRYLNAEKGMDRLDTQRGLTVAHRVYGKWTPDPIVQLRLPVGGRLLESPN